MLAQAPGGGEDDRLLFEAAYNELRRRAHFFLRRERPGHTLQPTEVVHEAWLRLCTGEAIRPFDRTRFLAVAGCVMRNILVDYARKRKAVCHGGDLVRTDFGDAFLFCHENYLQILEIDKALSRLAAIDPRIAELVELRFFAGLTESEAAEVLNVSPRSVKRDWSFAKAWMRTSLEGEV
jgi:RNA polymerase sigma-70 factor, ECF subfamily